MILVAGGTGTLGRELVRRLSASDDRVRVLTRRPARAQGLAADVVVGDVCDPRTLANAADGCDTVISAVHGFLGGRGRGPAAVDDRGNANLIRAAADAGAEHFVLLSVLDAGPEHPMSLHRAKYAAEQRLYGGTVAYTVLRPSAYLETWTAVIASKLPTGGPAVIFGRGDNPINFVSVLDVAALVDQAVHDPLLRGQAIDVPGPDNLSMRQLAHLLGATRLRRIPRSALGLMATAAVPIAPALARQAGAALVMDTVDMTAEATPLRTRFPNIRWHHAADLITADAGRPAGASGYDR